MLGASRGVDTEVKAEKEVEPSRVGNALAAIDIRETNARPSNSDQGLVGK